MCIFVLLPFYVVIRHSGHRVDYLYLTERDTYDKVTKVKQEAQMAAQDDRKRHHTHDKTNHSKERNELKHSDPQ